MASWSRQRDMPLPDIIPCTMRKKVKMFERLKAEMERNLVPVRELKGTRRTWNYFNYFNNFNKYKCNQKPSF
ncbi:MAG: hypothetical protein LBP76_00380 [Treponema sp.]|jgi:hypothetical protein|nr:hypothetical protein [Treponema sp.]